jgi:predicted transcriptional regulator
MRLKIYLEKTDKNKIAKRLGISRSALYNYAHGLRLTPLNVAFLIEEITHTKVTLVDLLQEWLEKNNEHLAR